MKHRLLEARRYGHFAIRGVLYAQRLSARDELAVALIHLKRDARKAARAAMDYLRNGGRADERPTLEQRERVLGLIRAHVESDAKGLKQWQKARIDLGVVKGAAGTVPGRSTFSTPPRATEPPPTRAMGSSVSTRRAVASEPSPTLPRPPWFGLCPQSHEVFSAASDQKLFQFWEIAFCSRT